jgi:ABC-type sugar transport system substrate-binding protein
VIEVFLPAVDLKQSKQGILQGCAENPDVAGIFLTHEHASLAYLELLQTGHVAHQQIQAVSYDITPEITNAIKDGRLLGTIDQDPARLGHTAAQALVELLQRPQADSAGSAKEMLSPVKKITRQTLPADL